jgi:hypothetical protein
MMRRLLLAATLLFPALALGQTTTPPVAGVQRIAACTLTSVLGNASDLTEDTMQTCTIPAGTLAATGNTLHIFASGKFIGSTDTKTARIKLGGQNVGIAQIAVTAAVAWSMDVWVVKTGASTQTYAASATIGNGTSGAPNSGTATVTDTGTITLLITGQNATNPVINSVTCQLVYVEIIQ